MKRVKIIDKYDYIKKIRPHFYWNECFVCGYEFRREFIWAFNSPPWYGGPVEGLNVFACLNCCPSKKTAHEKYEKYEKSLGTSLN
jgi:hypothetical protein